MKKHDSRRGFLGIAIVCAVIIAGIMAWVILGGCGVHKASRDYAWSEAYDADWKAVTDCWNAEPEKPNVRIRQDCYDTIPQSFDVYGYGRAYGQLNGMTVEVCPDLAALRHEMSHYVSVMVRGYPGENYEGKCWL